MPEAAFQLCVFNEFSKGLLSLEEWAGNPGSHGLETSEKLEVSYLGQAQRHTFLSTGNPLDPVTASEEDRRQTGNPEL